MYWSLSDTKNNHNKKKNEEWNKFCPTSALSNARVKMLPLNPDDVQKLSWVAKIEKYRACSIRNRFSSLICIEIVEKTNFFFFSPPLLLPSSYFFFFSSFHLVCILPLQIPWDAKQSKVSLRVLLVNESQEILKLGTWIPEAGTLNEDPLPVGRPQYNQRQVSHYYNSSHSGSRA